MTMTMAAWREQATQSRVPTWHHACEHCLLWLGAMTNVELQLLVEAHNKAAHS